MSTIEIKNKSELKPGDVATITRTDDPDMGEVTGTVYENWGKLALGGWFLSSDNTVLVRATREEVTERTLTSIYTPSIRAVDITVDEEETAEVHLSFRDTRTYTSRSITVGKADLVQALRDLKVIE